MAPLFRHKDNPPQRQTVSIVLVSVFFGFSAGLVGMLVTAAYLMPEPQGLNLGGLPYLRERIVLPAKGPERVASPVETAARSLVLFYPAKVLDRDRVAGREVFLPSEAVGAGMVLTSDGWLITHSDVLAPGAKPGAELAAVIGSRRYPVSETVRDPLTGLAFLKVEAANLQVVSFSSGPDLAAGDSVFAFDAGRGPRRFDAVGIGDQPPSVLAEAVRPSEKMQKTLRLAAAEAVLSGSMLLDNRGEVVGIFVKNDAIGSSAVPLQAFSGVIGSVLKDKAAKRPFLGVNYLVLADNRPGAMQGVLLTASPDGKRPAVLRQGPAAKAGLREGDIIVAVNDENVTANNDLPRIIAGYEPGSVVSFSYDRKGVTLTAEVTLGTAPTP